MTKEQATASQTDLVVPGFIGIHLQIASICDHQTFGSKLPGEGEAERRWLPTCMWYGLA